MSSKVSKVKAPKEPVNHVFELPEPIVVLVDKFRLQLPTIRFLALHNEVNLQCKWVFDFEANEFVSAAKQKNFKLQAPTEDLEAFVAQYTAYTNTWECQIRSQGHLITCWSGREMANFKLMETVLNQASQEIVDLVAPVRKGKAKGRGQTAASEKTIASEIEVPEDLYARLENNVRELEGYDFIAALAQNPYQVSYKLRESSSGRFLVLKHFNVSHLTESELQVLSAIEPKIDAFLPFGNHEPWQGKSIIRFFHEAVPLRELLRKVGQLSALQVQYILLKSSQALMPLHSADISHQSLVPANLMINRHKEILLSDNFTGRLHRQIIKGLTESQQADYDWLQDNRPFLAPEYFTDELTPAADVYALGALSVYGLVGHERFFDALAQAGTESLSATMINLAEGALESRYIKLRSLLAVMLAPVARDRPEIGTVMDSLIPQEKETVK